MQPELLIDRSLGTIAVPAFFAESWPSTVHTIDSVFGLGRVPDTTWMARADAEGWVAVTKDDRIRHRAGERELMSQGTLRVFCLTNGNLVREMQVDYFRGVLPDLLAQSLEPGPWMFGVYRRRIAELALRASSQ